MPRIPVAQALPDFPWDSLESAKAKAFAHPGGIVNLSVGTPVDPVAPIIQEALTAVAAVPGYPTTHGTEELRNAAVEALRRRYGITGIDPAAVLPAIGNGTIMPACLRTSSSSDTKAGSPVTNPAR